MSNTVVRYIALLGVCLFLAPADAADNDADTIPTVVSKMRNREKCTIDLHIKKTGEKYSVPSPGEISEPWLIERAFSATGDGDIVATVAFKKDSQSFTLVSKGLAEDIFVVRDLGLEKRFAKWYGKALEGIKSSKDVQALDLPHDTAKWVRIPEPSKEMSEVVGYAKAKYEDKRPELMKRFHNTGADTPANVFYPESGRLSWSVDRDGKKLYVSTTCANRVCVATSVAEFHEADDGTWRYVRLMAGEYYKGE